jgi:hypothetical protein
MLDIVVQLSMSDCQTDALGRFEPSIGMAPNDWPWALPTLYSVNYAPDPGEQLVGYSAKLDGSSKTISRFNNETFRVETVGYWHGDYRVVEVQRFRNKVRAEAYATTQFENLPVRYLMASGKVVAQRPDVEMTGEWSDEWQFRTIRELGVFCAYIYEKAQLRGDHDFAREFRSSIRAGWPVTILLNNYRQSLMFAKAHDASWAESVDAVPLSRAIEATETWLTSAR